MKITLKTKPEPLPNFCLLKLRNSTRKLVSPLCSCTACAQCFSCLTSFYSDPGSSPKKISGSLQRCEGTSDSKAPSEFCRTACKVQISTRRFAREDEWVSQPDYAAVPVKKYQLFLDFARQHNNMESVPNIPLMEIGKHCTVVTRSDL